MSLVKLNIARGVTGTLPTSNYVGGKLSQQIITQTSTETTCNSTSFIDLSGMTASITPVSASSTILFTISGVVNIDNNNANTYVIQNIYNVTDSSEEEQRTIIRVDTAAVDSYSFPYHQITWFYKRASWGTTAKSFKCQMKSENTDTVKWNRNAFATGSAQFMITEIAS